jgi:predicted alpha/beta superfamily hydrolase
MSYPAIDRFPAPSEITGSTYDIRIFSPKTLAAGAKNAPIFFVLDADLEFDLAVAVAQFFAIDKTIEPALVVGIGYGADYAEVGKLRTRDLTPPLSKAGEEALGSLANFIGSENGGAERFLAFMVEELTPEIARRRPEASPSRSILFGHSLGGLFVSYALLTRPDAFASYLAISPSLWWDGFAVLQHLPAFAERARKLPTPPKVLVAVGGKEQDVPDEIDPEFGISLADARALAASARMVDAAAEFAQSLRGLGLPDVKHVAFADEDHGSCLPGALSRAFVVALKRPLPAPIAS